MQSQRYLLFAVSLALAACSDTSVVTSTEGSVCGAHVVNGRLTVHVVEAEPGG